MLSRGVFQASQGAIPVLAYCLEHSIMAKQDPSSGEGTWVIWGGRDMVNTRV